MNRAYVSSVLPQPVEAVWAVLGDFHGLPSWMRRVHDAVPENGSGRGPVGSVRRLTVGEDRHTTRERLLSYDDAGRCYSYAFPAGPPLGLSAYRATLHVLPVTETGGTFVEWYGDYDVDPARIGAVAVTLCGLYTEFIGDLREHLAR